MSRPYALWSPSSWLPSFAERMAVGRPVFTREQAQQLAKHIMRLTTVDHARVSVTHTVRSITRLGNDQVHSTDDGDYLRLGIGTSLADSSAVVYIQTNQLDQRALHELVARADALAKEMGSSEKFRVQTWNEQDTYPLVQLWHDTSVAALHTAREIAIPQILETVQRQQFHASGFLGIMARAEAILTSEGITAYTEETDTEVSITARSRHGNSSGWSGQATRDWSTVDPTKVAADAVEVARRNLDPQAVEPGRRTAILGPGAVVQLMRFFALHFSGDKSDDGETGFSRTPGQRQGSRFNQRLFDPRIQISSNPADPEGGYRPWFGWDGLVSPTMQWVEHGVLKQLAYGVSSALAHGKQYADVPFSLRVDGGATTIEQMIAQCEEGIYVNRFSSVDMLDMHSGLLTGVTSDGCFLVKHGKIDRPVKNFRFLESPFFILNNLLALGPTRRTAFGYAPPTQEELRISSRDFAFFDWPRWPMIVPPIMVRDFNFSSLSETV